MTISHEHLPAGRAKVGRDVSNREEIVVTKGELSMAYGIGDTLFDACEDIRRRLTDGVTPEDASPNIKLITLMEALGGYWDRPPIATPSSDPFIS
jgi:hypothetical protein